MDIPKMTLSQWLEEVYVDIDDTLFELYNRGYSPTEVGQKVNSLRTLPCKQEAGEQQIKRRPDNFEQLAPAEQWEVDKSLGILDYAPE